MNCPRTKFRFEDLEVWHRACDISISLHHIAESLEQQKLFRYAEQLRAAGLSVANNIAEGSGSLHPQEFKQFLNIAKRSLFENASMLLVFERMDLWSVGTIDSLLNDCDHLSRKITNFSKTIR